MATSLDQVLGFRNLTGIAQGVIGGVPSDILPSGFTQTTRRIEGDRGAYKRVNSTRETARLVHYGSASRRRGMQEVAEIPFVALHTFEHQFHDISTLIQLERMESPELQQLGEQEIARQTQEFARHFSNLRIACIYSALARGRIDFDSDGNLLATGTGSVAVDFSIPANNQNQLNGIIGTTWATDTTDIAGDIKAIKEQARKDTGYPIRHAFYGANVFEYIISNTALGNLINGSPAISQTFSAAEIPNGFLGLNWHPANEAFFVDNDGNTNDFWGEDLIVFTPEPSPEWWEVVEGSFAVPTNMAVTNDANAVRAGSMTKVFGGFSYAHPSLDPPGIKHLAGDTFVPLIKVPGAVFLADVTP